MVASTSRRQAFGTLSLVIAVGLIAAAFLTVGTVFYVRGRLVMAEQLKLRLRIAAAAAAMQFEGEDLDRIDDTEDMSTERFRAMVGRLRGIRENVPDIRYTYIMRRTPDPLTLEFVADADSLLTPEEADLDHNGIVEEEEAISMPGDLYDITEVPTLQEDAFNEPSTDQDITRDQWGTLISGYAPIRRADGSVAGVLGLDMGADDFVQLSNRVFSAYTLAMVIVMALFLCSYLAFLLWQRRVAMLQQADEERSQLVSLALHQLGTPLSIFRWWLEILEERYGPKICTETDACRQLHDGIDRMQQVYNALQEAQRASMGTYAYHEDTVSLPTTIQMVAAEVLPQLKRNGQQLVTRVEPDLTVSIDRKLLSGILSELIVNASVYSPKDTTIIVSVQRKRNSAVITVADQGYGIHPDDVPNITRKFFRGRNASTHKAAGNGMGLFIARSIMERAGGRLLISSTLDKGTTVTLILPLIRKRLLWFLHPKGTSRPA